jgi:serine/threonine protein kinase/tetratricopeptide (TPR) repeat protein
MNSIGRYQLVEKLGQGGMGVVYRAFDTLLQRVVAIKVISRTEPGAEQRERFFREARAAGQLSHRNIITIHDLGEHEDQPYLAMEFLEGEDLQHRLARPDRMSLARKVELIIEVCEGLAYAHARGIVHRDIKPANIFITDSGTAKILDFGLARLVTSELTNSNMMMGTINYMAPEQVRGERADHRADIFSVGVVFYELLCGRKAFEGESFAATLYKILQEVPEPLPNIDPGVPPELVGIVDRALAKPRDERYQHMTEMLQDLAVYRQQMIAFDSPAAGRPGSGSHRQPSDPPQRLPPTPGSDAPTIAHGTTPFPAEPARPSSGAPPATGPMTPPQPVGFQSPSGERPVSSRRGLWIGGAAALLAVAALAVWATRDTQSPPPAGAAPAAGVDHAAVATAVRRAAQALEAGDFDEARRQADAALALSPGDAEALRVRERASATLESVNRGLRDARAHYQAGNFEEASRAAGDVLSLAPGQPEAQKLMQDAAARSRGRGADDARRRMNEAKAAARSAGAMNLAAASYTAAVGAERTAQRLYDAGQLADATAKYYEASGLFRSAELAAQSETAARAERAEEARVEKQRTETDRAAARGAPPPAGAANSPPAATTPQPATPVVRGADPLTVGATPVPAPPPPPKTAAPPAAPAKPQEPPADALIAQLLAQYEAALEDRSLSALKRLWPGLGGTQESAIRNEFQHASRIEVEIVSPRIDVAGDTAIVTFTRRYALLTTDGQRLNSQSVTTMNLRRATAGWMIDRVRFDPMR